MVQSRFVPESKQSATAVVVSGGKQYRVSAGDQILVGRVKAEVGSELIFDRVLLHVDGDEIKVGTPGIEGLTVTARVLQHSRGPRIEVGYCGSDRYSRRQPLVIEGAIVHDLQTGCTISHERNPRTECHTEWISRQRDAS